MQLFLIISGLLLLFLFLAPIFEDVFNIATIIGCLMGVFPLILGILWKNINAKLAVILLAGFAFVSVTIICLMIFIFIKGKSKATDQKIIIVLGCKVKGDKPSLSLLKRIESAYEFLIKNENCVAVLSGGQGADENISEAQCMYNLLREKGIDKNRLIIEDKSTSTDENIRFSKELINGREVAIATSEYHQLRAGMICKRHGLNAYAQSSKTKPSILPTFLLREILGIVKEMICSI